MQLGNFIDVQGDSKRLTQLKSKRRLNTRHAVGCWLPYSKFSARSTS